MYFQESRFGSLDVVFVENDHLLTGAQYTMTQNVAEATAFIVGRLFVMSAISMLQIRHS